MTPRKLSYNEWVEYCFDRPVSDPQWYWQWDENGGLDWYEPDPVILAEYLAVLFSSSAELLASYTEEQVAQGLYFIFSAGSSYLHDARSELVPQEKRVLWVKAIQRLYPDLFSSGCSHFYGHLGRGPETERPLNGLCYMLWDLDCIEGAAMFPGEGELVEPIFDALHCGLYQSNPACVESALHGLGHLQRYYPDRVQEEIKGLLVSRPDLTDELKQYAQNAMHGCVQ